MDCYYLIAQCRENQQRQLQVFGHSFGVAVAEKPGKHGYVEHKLMTSFCAVFPISNPRYIVFVMLDEPHGTKETFGFALAGYTAAPLAGRVIARIAPMLSMPTSAPLLMDAKENT